MNTEKINKIHHTMKRIATTMKLLNEVLQKGTWYEYRKNKQDTSYDETDCNDNETIE